MSNRHRFSFVLVSALFLVVAFGPARAQETRGAEGNLPVDTVAIEGVVRSVFDAIVKRESTSIKEMLSARARESNSFGRIAGWFGDYKEITLVKMGTIDVATVPGGARCRVVAEFTGVYSNTGKVEAIYASNNRLVVLAFEDGRWRLEDHISVEHDLTMKLLNARGEDERKQILAANRQFVTADLTEAITKEGNRVYGSIPWPKVLNIYQLGLKVAEEINDKKEIALALNSIGNASKNAGDATAARSAYERSLKISSEIGDKENIARVAYNIADVVENRDEMLERSLKVAREIENKSLIAVALGAIGNNHTMRGEYVQARQVLEEAMAVRRELGGPDEIAIGLSNLSILHQLTGDFEQARLGLEESIGLSETIGNNVAVMIDLYNLGNVFQATGDFSRSMAYYDKSLMTGKKVDPTDENAPVLINMAGTMAKQGSLDKAEELFRRTLSAFENGKSNYGISRALGGLSDVYEARGNCREALNFALRAHEIYVLEKDEQIVESLSRLARLYESLGERDMSATKLNEAIETSRKSGSRLGLYNSHLTFAEFEYRRGDTTKALTNLDLAAKAYDQFDLLADAWKFYFTRGEINFALRRVAYAKSDLIRAVSIIEKQRGMVAGGESESQKYLSTRLRPYTVLVDVLFDEGSAFEAFRVAERMKARALIDTLQQQSAFGRVTLPPGEAEKERKLRAEIVGLSSQITKEAEKANSDKNVLARLKENRDRGFLELEGLYLKQYVSRPELRLARAEMTPVSEAEMGSIIPNDRSVVAEFVVGEQRSHVFIWSISASGKPVLQAYKIHTEAGHLGTAVGSLRTKIAAGDLDFQKASRELYDLLLKPAAAQLAGKTNIVIVPDGPLWDLPFQALQDEKGKFLVEKAAMSYAPSLTALREMSKKAKTRRPDAGMELLAFGNPIVGAPTKERVQRVFMSEKLEPIPEAERLVKELGKMYGPTRSKVFTGGDAREEIAKTESPKYRIVQFATHGILNNVSPMYSHLVLAQNEKNPNEDGLLEAWELKDLDLKADMVILSACETARGKISNGEGMIGMTWASFIAGAPTTVASQWKVESTSTTELMLEFHRQLLAKQRVSKAEALRRASLKLMRDPRFKHPSYWAGFVIVGDGS